MENNVENTKIKKLKTSLAIILLIVIILVVSMLGAYAIYTTTQNENIGVDIAQFSFNVDLKKINNGQDSVVNLADTILGDTTNGNVQSGKIAPGTYGAFDLMMDGSDSGVSLDYYININTKVNTESEEGYLPRNLKFYRLKEGKTEETINEESLEDTNEATARFEQIGTDGSIRITGDISARATNANKIKSERIYWIWPYETALDTNLDDIETVEEGDKFDSEDMDNNLIKDGSGNITGMKKIILPIKVSAEQKTENSKKRLAYLVKVGDVINNYSVPNVQVTGTATNHSDNLLGTSLNGTLSTSDVTSWRVLSIEGEEVNIVANTLETTVTIGKDNDLEAIDGYYNAERALNNVCEVFKNVQYASKARSLCLEDLEQYYKTDKTSVRIKYCDIHNISYGWKNEETIYPKVPGNNSVTLTSDYIQKLIGKSVSGILPGDYTTNNYYTQTGSESKKYLNKDYMYDDGSDNMIFDVLFRSRIGKNTSPRETWLATTSRNGTVKPTFAIFRITVGLINSCNIYSVNGEAKSATNKVTPVVTLKSNVKGDFKGTFTLEAGKTQMVNEWDILN